jgi:hypothetical protein
MGEGVDHLDDADALKAALIETRAKLSGAEALIAHQQLLIGSCLGDVSTRFSKGSARNAPTLFWMGAVPSAWCPNEKRSNSLVKKARTV